MKPRNNGFFDESDTLNTQRANAMNSDKMIDDLNILENESIVTLIQIEDIIKISWCTKTFWSTFN